MFDIDCVIIFANTHILSFPVSQPQDRRYNSFRRCLKHENILLLISTNNGKTVHKRYQLVLHLRALMRGDMEPQDSASGSEKWSKWAHGGVLRWR